MIQGVDFVIEMSNDRGDFHVCRRLHPELLETSHFAAYIARGEIEIVAEWNRRQVTENS